MDTVRVASKVVSSLSPDATSNIIFLPRASGMISVRREQTGYELKWDAPQNYRPFSRDRSC
jgi:hypothetical protein